MSNYSQAISRLFYLSSQLNTREAQASNYTQVAYLPIYTLIKSSSPYIKLIWSGPLISEENSLLSFKFDIGYCELAIYDGLRVGSSLNIAGD